MIVQNATMDDVENWLDLAREVEFLFGPMASEPGFHSALRKNISRGSAFCVREGNGQPGAALTGGLLFSAKPPIYHIGWLSVAERTRRQGIGMLLVKHAMDLVQTPAELRVVTFGEDNPEGLPARRLYARAGSEPFEKAEPGPEGGSREVLRMVIS